MLQNFSFAAGAKAE